MENELEMLRDSLNALIADIKQEIIEKILKVNAAYWHNNDLKNATLPSQDRNYMGPRLRLDPHYALTWEARRQIYKPKTERKSYPVYIKKGQKGTGYSANMLARYAAPWALEMVLATEKELDVLRRQYNEARDIARQMNSRFRRISVLQEQIGFKGKSGNKADTDQN